MRMHKRNARGKFVQAVPRQGRMEPNDRRDIGAARVPRWIKAVSNSTWDTSEPGFSILPTIKPAAALAMTTRSYAMVLSSMIGQSAALRLLNLGHERTYSTIITSP